MTIESLVRENIRSLQPYHSARQDYCSGVLLDANENAFGSVLDVGDLSLNRYPDPYQREIRGILAAMNGVSPENVFVGVGSDEVIDNIVRVFCNPKSDSVVLLEPTYGMYRVAASIQDVEIRSCLLTHEFQIDIAAVQRTVDRTTKLIFCCSPNNPTGNLLRSEDILALCDLGPAVVVDEAYVDFAKSESLAKQVLTHPHLLVMRTLSKAWGLAGIRLGYCVADAAAVGYMMKVKAPYNINILTSTATLGALKKQDTVQATIAKILAERTFLVDGLAKLPCIRQVFPSDANFILARCTDAPALYERLASRNIIVRNRSTEPMLQNCLRITVGTHAENELLLRALQESCL